jgi:hypothetical protein
LWIGYSDSVVEGDILRLHCRHCVITEIKVNGLSAEWELRDPLNNILPAKKKEHQGAILDNLYRMALEVSREGELAITLPAMLESQWQPLPPLPPPSKARVHKDIITRHRGLVLLQDELIRKSVMVGSISAYDVDDDLDGNDCADGNSESKGDNKPLKRETPTRMMYILQVQIKYSISHSTEAKMHGVVFRKESYFIRKFDHYRGSQASAAPTSFNSTATPLITATQTRNR